MTISIESTLGDHTLDSSMFRFVTYLADRDLTECLTTQILTLFPDCMHTWNGHKGESDCLQHVEQTKGIRLLNHIWKKTKKICRLLNAACCDGNSTPFS